MARNPRDDEPDTWHHVMNRGIARRAVFESRDDIRYFLSRIAWAVRRGELELHAYCVMATHYHLLVRSPHGRLSEGMRRVQNEYVRSFNRSRRRDGPLFRGRFRSKPVESLAYRHALVRYIDFNPVEAGSVPAPGSYPHGSARHHASGHGPPWLERSWVESVLRTANVGAASGNPYVAEFGKGLAAGVSELVERRLAGRSRARDPLDELLAAAPPEILSWMRRRARLADGSRPGLALCDAESVSSTVRQHEAEADPWYVTPGRKRMDAWFHVHVGLLRDLAGLSGAHVALRLGCSGSTASLVYRRHRALLLEDTTYGERASRTAAEAWRRSGLGDSARILAKWS